MKTVLPLLLFAFIMHGQTQSYTPSTASFPNPERGYYHYTSTGGTTATYTTLNQSTLDSYRGENITVIERMFYLNSFVSSPISDSYLANMQSDFDKIRNAGLKVIIRFAYSKSESVAVLDATKTQILAHIQQVAPLIQANKDVISIYQYGWIGCWGETYYTSQIAEFGNGDTTAITTAQWANRKQIVDAMLAATPIEIPIQVRYVYDKQRMYPTGNNRIGFYNDAFLNVWGDSGTFNVSGAGGIPTTADSNYLQTETVSLPMAGETDALNAPRTDCANALLEMDKYNWSLLNKDYLTANIVNWTSQGCFAETERRLGYRFELINSSVANNVLNFTVQNVGFANLFKDRKAFLILRNLATNDESSFELNTNLKNWKGGAPIQVSQTLALAVGSGTYQLFLSLPDPLLTSPMYAIQCANSGIWDAVKGYNNLNQTVTISGEVIPVTQPVVAAPVVDPAILPVAIVLNNNAIIIVNNLPSPAFTIAVYNLNGRLKSTSVDISGLRKGIYVVKITCDGIVYTQKVNKV